MTENEPPTGPIADRVLTIGSFGHRDPGKTVILNTAAPTAAEVLAAFRHDDARIAAAWLLGGLSDLEKDAVRRAADGLGLRDLVNALDAADPKEYWVLLDAVGCASNAEPVGPAEPPGVAWEGPADTPECAELAGWLAGVGVIIDGSLRAAALAAVLDHLAGPAAADRFAELRAAFEAFRARLAADGLTAADRTVLASFPHLVDADDPAAGWRVDYPLFAWRRLLWLVRERSATAVPDAERWRVKGGLRRLADRGTPQAVRRLAGLLALCLAEPAAADDDRLPVVNEGPPDLPGLRPPYRTAITWPTSLTRLVEENHARLREKLEELRLVPHLLEKVGLEDRYSDGYLGALFSARPAPGARFRERMVAALQRYTAQVRGRPVPLLSEDQFREAVEQAVVERLLLRELYRPGESHPRWRADFLHEAIRERAWTTGRLDAVGADAADDRLDSYKNQLLARAIEEVDNTLAVFF